MDKLIYSINTKNTLKGSLTSSASLKGFLILPEYISSDYDIYDGEYEIIPAPFEDKVLSTENKLMQADVTVKEIPYFETSNLSGGNTVYIGGD